MKKLSRLAAVAGVTAFIGAAQTASADHCPIWQSCKHCQQCQDEYTENAMCYFDMNGSPGMAACWEEQHYDANGEVLYETCEGNWGCFTGSAE